MMKLGLLAYLNIKSKTLLLYYIKVTLLLVNCFWPLNLQ